MTLNYQAVVQVPNPPQSQPVMGANQVKNSAGGFVFQIDKWARLRRFLILGTDGGTYYLGERELTVGCAEAVDACLAEDFDRALADIVQVSEDGRAPSNEPALFALARACAFIKPPDLERFKQLAYPVIPRVARTGTHLFHFVRYVQSMRGWGRGIRRAVANWYLDKEPGALAYQLMKYKQRDGWTHRDVLRLSHPKPKSDVQRALFHLATKGDLPDMVEFSSDKERDSLTFAITAIRTQLSEDAKQTAEDIRSQNIPRECVNTALLNNTEIWEALLEKMPMTALIRNLAKLSSLGMLERYSDNAKRVAEKIVSREHLHASRVHPIAILAALATYRQGHGVKGKLTWQTNQDILEALNDAFYAAFDNVPTTPKRFLLGLDISGSMHGGTVSGIAGLTPIEAVTAMSLVTLKANPTSLIKGFSGGSNCGFGGGPGSGAARLQGFCDLPISPRRLLGDCVCDMKKLGFGPTDCALPMVWAAMTKQPIDTFVVYTDNETWVGPTHPFQALEFYRKEMGAPDAKLIVVATAATQFTIANPQDAHMLDIPGFDTAVPNVIHEFATGLGASR